MKTHSMRLILATALSAFCFSLSCAKEDAADAVKTALKTKVSFDFTDMPLETALNRVVTMADVKLAWSPKITEAQKKTAISFSVDHMACDLALEWVMKLAEVEYHIVDGAVFVTIPNDPAFKKKDEPAATTK